MNLRAICAVVVLYLPDSGVQERINRIKQQVGAVVIVDNSGNDAPKIVPEWEAEPRIYLIRNEFNLGVAIALNQGVQWAEQHGFKWVLLFDQDTEPMEGMSHVLMDVYQACCKSGKKALVGANYINGLGKIQVSCQEETLSWVEQKTIITSGTLLSLELYHLIGSFRDDFFIDAVDYEYCLKARARGIRVVLSCEPLMSHTIGMQTRHSFPWKKTAVSNHNAVRRYFMARNNLVLVREYWLKEPVWVLGTVSFFIKTIVLISCFEENKMAKLSAVATGLWHAVIGKPGYVRN